MRPPLRPARIGSPAADRYENRFFDFDIRAADDPERAD
jgi:hypothetical protein